jgi:hypothetical protein
MSCVESDVATIANAVFLDPMLNITKYFPENYNPPEEHAHIIVQHPVTTGKLSQFLPPKQVSHFLSD